MYDNRALSDIGTGPQAASFRHLGRPLLKFDLEKIWKRPLSTIPRGHANAPIGTLARVDQNSTSWESAGRGGVFGARVVCCVWYR